MRSYAKTVIVATWIGIIVNVILTIVKAIGGVISGSRALLADAAHSASDIVGSVAVLFAVRIASKPPDEEHPYGHGKAENVAAIVVALLLIIVGFEISISSVKSFFGEPPRAPKQIALYILIFAIVVKEFLFYYKISLGKKHQSSALIAEAWHHRSDSLSSIAALIGVGLAIVGQKFNIEFLIYSDAISGLVVSIIVIKVGFSLAKDSANVILETVLPEKEIDKYKATVLNVDGVVEIDELLARTHGSYIVIDIKISVDPHISVEAGHTIAKETKQALMNSHAEVENVLVHINPYNPESYKSDK